MSKDNDTAAKAALPPPDCSALSSEQLAILRHTAYHAASCLYCGGGPEMDDLVARGLMQSAGRKSFVPDEYFRITSAGREALKPNAKLSHPASEPSTPKTNV